MNASVQGLRTRRKDAERNGVQNRFQGNPPTGVRSAFELFPARSYTYSPQ